MVFFSLLGKENDRMSKMTRRSVLVGSGALCFGSSAVGYARLSQAATPLRVVLELESGRTVFDEDKSEDMGDYIAPSGKFVQHCRRVKDQQTPFTVMFRPDGSSDRVEIVVEFGRLWNGRPYQQGPYTATIMRGNTILASVKVPVHYWLSRWRWQSESRPILHAASDLMRSGKVPPYAVTQFPIETGSDPEWMNKKYAVMGLAGLTPYMPATGERPEIGPLTEPAAQWLVSAEPSALAAMLAQAEASGTFPWHFRDEETGAPLNLDLHPTAGWSSSVCQPLIATMKSLIPSTNSQIVVDTAHQPSLAYMPYLLTEDPYYLEELQFAVTLAAGRDPVYREKSNMIIGASQVRSLAWMLRSMAHAALVTPVDTPQWLLPKVYWVRKLANNREWFDRTYTNSASPERVIFRTAAVFNDEAEGPIPRGTYEAPWQDEFLAFVLWWMVQMGFHEWQPAAEWSTLGTVARTNGTSGWPPSFSTPYRLLLRSNDRATFVKSWEEAWNLNKSVQNWTMPSDGHWVAAQSPTYLTYTRGVLAIAASQKFGAAMRPLAWVDRQLAFLHAKVPYKWQISVSP
jgi:hypothetical protein